MPIPLGTWAIGFFHLPTGDLALDVTQTLYNATPVSCKCADCWLKTVGSNHACGSQSPVYFRYTSLHHRGVCPRLWGRVQNSLCKSVGGRCWTCTNSIGAAIALLVAVPSSLRRYCFPRRWGQRDKYYGFLYAKKFFRSPKY